MANELAIPAVGTLAVVGAFKLVRVVVSSALITGGTTFSHTAPWALELYAKNYEHAQQQSVWQSQQMSSYSPHETVEYKHHVLDMAEKSTDEALHKIEEKVKEDEEKKAELANELWRRDYEAYFKTHAALEKH
jgi:transcriptional regulator of nitric oxide reductase